MTEARDRDRWIERLPLLAERPWLALAGALAMIAIAFVLRFAILPLVPVGSPFLTFFPAVVLVGFLLGARLGLVALAVSIALGAAFFMTDPMAPGYFVRVLPSVVTYSILAVFTLALFHWMQTANTKLRIERERSAALAETREILFRELQHRVSNNLQVAAALLSLQKRHVTDRGAQAALEEASRRIGVIGRISRQLYEPDGGTRSVHALLAPLCADVVDAAGKSGVVLRVSGGEDEALAPSRAIPVALIVAEAVANAIEHGFAGRDAGAIHVVCARGDAGGGGRALTVEIRDDGRGLPEGFAMENGLGLRIATMLAGQLGGRFEMVAGEGATARLVLPG